MFSTSGYWGKIPEAIPPDTGNKILKPWQSLILMSSLKLWILDDCACRLGLTHLPCICSDCSPNSYQSQAKTYLGHLQIPWVLQGLLSLVSHVRHAIPVMKTNRRFWRIAEVKLMSLRRVEHNLQILTSHAVPFQSLGSTDRWLLGFLEQAIV